MSISTKILCAVLSVSFLFMAAWGLVSYQLEKQDLSSRLELSTALTAERLGHSLAYPLWNLDDVEIGRILDYEARSGNIRAIILRDENGQFIAGRSKVVGSRLRQDAITAEQERQWFGSSPFSANAEITQESKELGRVIVYAEDAPLHRKLVRSLTLFAVVAVLICFGLSATLYIVLRYTIVRPLMKVKQAVAHVSIENLAVPIPVSGNDEIGRLAQRFREMTRELQASLERQQQMNEQLLQAQKMEAIGMLVGGVSHDFNNILGAIIGSAEMMRLLLQREQLNAQGKIERHVTTISDSARRASELIRQLLILSMKQEVNLASIDLREVVEHVVKLLRSSQDKSIRLSLELPEEPALVSADSVQMEQVLLNLCINACHAMTLMRAEGERWGGELKVRLARAGTAVTSADGGSLPGDESYWQLQVSDTGVGIDSDLQRHIFTPFFTTKEKAVGSGLGLSMAYSIVKQQDGHLAVESEPGRGSTFRILLPAVDPQLSVMVDAPFEESEEVLPVGSGLVLVVDDDSYLQEIYSQVLTECGFEVLIAENGAEGIVQAERHGPDIRLVVLDMNMPVMSGVDALPRIRVAACTAKILLTSGYKQDPRVQELRQRGEVDGFIHKPYSLHRLAWKVHALLQERAADS